MKKSNPFLCVTAIVLLALWTGSCGIRGVGGTGSDPAARGTEAPGSELAHPSGYPEITPSPETYTPASTDAPLNSPALGSPTPSAIPYVPEVPGQTPTAVPVVPPTGDAPSFTNTPAPTVSPTPIAPEQPDAPDNGDELPIIPFH